MSFLRRLLSPASDAPALPPEIAFLLWEGVPAACLARAAALARASGTDAATALLNAGWIHEDVYYRALARALGAPFLDGAIPFGPGLRYPDSLVAGLAPLATGAGAPCVLAPRGPQVAELLETGYRRGMPAITTPTRLREAVFAARGPEIAAYAADNLQARAPHWAFGREPANRWLLFLGLLACTALCLFAALPPELALAVTVVVQIVFLAMTGLRIGAAFLGAGVIAERVRPLADAELPTYTVMVALYREGAVVDRLVRALARLDYPLAKLDVKFLIEADDAETARALGRIVISGAMLRFRDQSLAPRHSPR